MAGEPRCAAALRVRAERAEVEARRLLTTVVAMSARIRNALRCKNCGEGLCPQCRDSLTAVLPAHHTRAAVRKEVARG